MTKKEEIMPAIQAKIVGDFCNLRCSYCRDRDFDQKGKRVMAPQVLQALIHSLSQLPQSVQRIHWLGGEPTLAGLDFFKEVVRLQQECVGKRWVNTIQTNATTINRKWAEFFKAHDFKVGVSVDGTSQTHDADRINLAGRGSYTKVMNGVRILREEGIYPSVICVVTKKNAEDGALMLRSLVGSGFTSIAFNAFYNTATNLNSDPFAVSDKAWTQFLIDIFEEWVMLDRADVQVRELDNMIAWTQGRVAHSCVFRGSCSTWMLVDYDGKTYPCERLGRPVSFGDITSALSFSEILRADAYREFTSQTLRLPETCKVCPMQTFCHNGCVAHRVDDG
ncbi:MAG: radical SAM protein, partial [bacterium]|nr:radical SAM protein [bacterium]